MVHLWDDLNTKIQKKVIITLHMPGGHSIGHCKTPNCPCVLGIVCICSGL